MNLLALVLLSLAASRVVHLVSDDDFPFGGLRYWLNSRNKLREDKSLTVGSRFALWLGHGMNCTFCCSVWAGFASSCLAAYAGWSPVDAWGDWPMFMVVWFAVSQTIVLIELAVYRLMGDD